MKNEEEVDQINHGYDRGVDYKEMKKKFIDEYNKLESELPCLEVSDRWFESKKKKIISKKIYLLVAMIQLSNGSRIIEACSAFRLFLKNGINDMAVVKIAKSKSTKVKNGIKYKTPQRFRKIKFPKTWIELDGVDELVEYSKDMLNLRHCVLNYLLRNFGCNTHSLRYAFINYMLYEKKQPMTVVAKFVGHSNVNQLVRYTQAKESDKLFDMDI